MDGGSSDPDERAGPRPAASASERPLPRHRERPFPASRCVLCSPVGEDGAGTRTETPDYAIVIAAAALRSIHAHLEAGRGEPRFGFLLGDLCRCPETGRRYAWIDTPLPARDRFVEDEAASCLEGAWTKAREAFLRRGGILLGWYHSHPAEGLAPSHPDLAAHRRYFREPWQAAVVVDPDPHLPRGALYRGPEGRLDARPASFYELCDELAEAPAAAAGPRWRNYSRRGAFVSQVVPARGGAPGEAGSRRPPAGHPRSLRGLGASLRRLLPGRARRPAAAVGLAALLVLLAASVLWRPSPSPTSEPSGGASATGASVAAAALMELNASARAALDAYAGLRDDFRIGLVGCDRLTEGRALADDAYGAAAGVFGRLTMPSRRVVAQVRAFEGLAARMDSVRRHFEESRCAGPRAAAGRP